ncbi:polysaccharide deacetylase family protein [Nonomuraea sp. NPDC046802]|uniref:polysaccharide deacetylase family protein n=1 Tax=Nonomuraea sp. NPDC046802 TaxID=3154919 RepID=UPI0033F67367
MHKMRFFSGIALLAFSAAGCSLAATNPGKDVVVPAEPTLIDFVDPATVVGLSTETLSEGHAPAGRYVHINYPKLADAPALNRALRAQAERQLRDFKSRTNRKVGPEMLRPELNMDWQLAASTPEAVGVRLRTGEFLGANWSTSTRTFWFDPRNGRAVGSTGLLNGRDGLGKLEVLVKNHLKKNQLADDLFDSMAFNRNGDLVVEFDHCQVGPCSLGRQAVAVPAAQAGPLLSDLGRRAQRAVRERALTALREAPEMTTRPTSPDAVSNRAGSVDCAKAKCVALTFDDGPGPYTGRLLDILLRNRARATFFTVGMNAAAQPGLLGRMSAEGHLVGNHSWAHHDLSKQPSSKVADSIARTEDTISAAIGQRPQLVRPPFGAMSQELHEVARERGLSLITWDVDAEDQVGSKSGDITDRTVRKAHPGAIILMHDIYRESVDAVPDILKRLRGKGYSFVTVPELYGSADLQAGRLYRSGNELRGRPPLT